MKITDVKEIWVSVDTRNQVQRLDLFYENTDAYKNKKKTLRDEELNAKTLVDWMDSDYKKSLEEELKENDYFYYFEIVSLNDEIEKYYFNEFLDYGEELIECIVKEDIDDNKVNWIPATKEQYEECYSMIKNNYWDLMKRLS